jgi:hypothetical protein
MDDNTRHRYRLPMRARVATTVGGMAAAASRLAGKGDGSVIGGNISLRLEPGLLSLLAAGREVVLVTGTNGKTTTSKLITAALAPLGGEIASNIYGANMEAGLTSALTRSPDARVAVLETDEKYIPAMIAATKPKVVVLLNLSRDQMDRAAGRRSRARRTAGWWPTPTTRWSRGRRAPPPRQPGWRPASAGARTRGAALTAAPTWCATATTGPARSAACGGRR